MDPTVPIQSFSFHFFPSTKSHPKSLIQIQPQAVLQMIILSEKPWLYGQLRIDLILSLSKLHYHQSLLLPNLNFTNKIDSANGHSSPYGKAPPSFTEKPSNFYLRIILNLTILANSWCSLLPFSASGQCKLLLHPTPKFLLEPSFLHL